METNLYNFSRSDGIHTFRACQCFYSRAYNIMTCCFLSRNVVNKYAQQVNAPERFRIHVGHECERYKDMKEMAFSEIFKPEMRDKLITGSTVIFYLTHRGAYGIPVSDLRNVMTDDVNRTVIFTFHDGSHKELHESDCSGWTIS